MTTEKIHESRWVLWGTLVVVMFFSLGMIFGLIIPKIKEVYREKDLLEEKKLQFALIQKDAAFSFRYSELTKNLKSDQALLEGAIIKNEAVVVFIQQIEKAAVESGGSIKINQIQAPKKKTQEELLAPDKSKTEDGQGATPTASGKETPSGINLRVNFKGNYRNFMLFVHKIENIPFVFRIDRVVVQELMTKSSEVEGEKKLDQNLQADLDISFDIKK